jgi:hypothetical protein
MRQALTWLASVLWLAIKMAVILFLLSPQQSRFIYQNF